MAEMFHRISNFRTYGRIRTLWEEYMKLCSNETDDPHAVLAKLSEFLDSFQSTFLSLTNNGEKNWLFFKEVDCTPILVALLNIVDREAAKLADNGDSMVLLNEVMNKALGVAELILQDEKYRKVVRETPDLMNRILSLLEVLKDTETRKVALRVISRLADDAENKIAIGNLDGFRRIFGLLTEQDQDLTREILKTLRHFLESSSATPQEFEKVVSTTAALVERSPAAQEAARGISPLMSKLSGMWGSLVSTVWENKGAGTPTAAGRAGMLNLELQESDFAPPAAAITDALEMAQKLLDEDRSMDDRNVPNPTTEDSSDKFMQEFMRVQGGLKTLTSALTEAALTVRLDLLGTISKLLYNNRRNQIEFARMEGYSSFVRAMDRVQDFSSAESKTFLQECLGLFFTVILDGNPTGIVGNIGALRLVLTLATTGQFDVRFEAMRCIRDVLAVNALNAAYFEKIDGIMQCIALMETRGRAPSCSNGEEAFFAYMIDTMNYAGYLLSNRSDVVLEEYARLAGPGSRLAGWALFHVVSGICKLLSDKLAREAPLRSPRLVAGRLVAALSEVAARRMGSGDADTHEGGSDPFSDAESDRDMDDGELGGPNSSGGQNTLGLPGSNSNKRDGDAHSARGSVRNMPRGPPPPSELVSLLEALALLGRFRGVKGELEEADASGRTLFQNLAAITVASRRVEVVEMVLCAAYDLLVTAENIAPRCIEVFTSIISKCDLANRWQLHTVTRACTALADTFELCPSLTRAAALRAAFVQTGGLGVIVDTLQAGVENRAVVRCALRVIAEVITDCDEYKTALEERIDLERFGRLLVKSGVGLEPPLYDVTLELAFTPSFRKAMGEVTRVDEAEGGGVGGSLRMYSAVFPSAAEVKRTLTRLRNPTYIFAVPLPCSRAPNGTVYVPTNTPGGPPAPPPGSVASTTLDQDSVSSVSGRTHVRHPSMSSMRSSMRRQSLSSEGNDAHALEHALQRTSSRQSTAPAQSVAGTTATASANDDPRISLTAASLTALDDNRSTGRNSLTRGSVGRLDSSRSSVHRAGSVASGDTSLNGYDAVAGLDTMEKYLCDLDPAVARALSLLTLRGANSARLIWQTLPSIKSMPAKRGLLVFLLRVLELNPTNKGVMVAADGMRAAMSRALEAPAEVAALLCDVAVVIGSYHISPTNIIAMTSLARPEAASGGRGAPVISAMPINVLRRVAQSPMPPTIMKFNGIDQMTTLGPAERLPRNAFTISMWLRVDALLDDPAGVLTLADSASGDSCMEMYVRTAPVSAPQSTTPVASPLVPHATSPAVPSPVVSGATPTSANLRVPGFPDVRHQSRAQRLVLCVRASASLQEYMYGAVELVVGATWVNVVYTHKKPAGASLYIDGKLAGRHSECAYPPKVKNLVAHVGSLGARIEKGRTHFFCGQIGGLRFIDGECQPDVAMRVFRAGVLFDGPLKTLGLEGKEFVSASQSPSSNSLVRSSNDLNVSGGGLTISLGDSSRPQSPSGDLGTPTNPHLPSLSSVSVGGMSSDGESRSAWSKTDDHVRPSPRSAAPASARAVDTRPGDVHQTLSIKNVVRQMGGVASVCFPLLRGARGEAETEGLWLLLSLLKQSPTNLNEFYSNSMPEGQTSSKSTREADQQPSLGISVLHHVLRQSEAGSHAFETLFELAREFDALSPTPFSQGCCDAMQVVMDLLNEGLGGESLRKSVLNKLCDYVLSVENGPALFASKFGVYALFELMDRLPVLCHVPINVLRRHARELRTEDMIMLLECMCAQETNDSDVRREFLSFLLEEVKKYPPMIDMLKRVDIHKYLLLLLESGTEVVRVLSLCVACAVRYPPPAATRFFEVALNRLKSFATTRPICNALLNLSMGYIIYDEGGRRERSKKSEKPERDGSSHGKKKSSIQTAAKSAPARKASGSVSFSDMQPTAGANISPPTRHKSAAAAGDRLTTDGTTTATPQLEALNVLFQLLRDCLDETLVIAVMVDLDQLLSVNARIEMLWKDPASSWLEWVEAFVRGRVGDARTLHCPPFDTLFRRTLLWDLNRQDSRVEKIKEMEEAPEFQVFVIENVILALNERPVLSLPEGASLPSRPDKKDVTAVLPLMTNLVTLLEGIEDLMSFFPPELCETIIGVINNMAFQNSPVVRMCMDVSHLLRRRDDLILFLLGQSENPADVLPFVQSFDFSSIAHQAYFRKEKGLTLLLALFHNAKDIPQLQEAVFDIIRNCFGPIEENRKELKNLIGDEHVLPYFQSDQVTARAVRARLDLDEEDDEPLTSASHFVRWYYGAEMTKARDHVEKRVAKSFLETQKQWQKNMTRTNKERSKRRERRTRGLNKSRAQLDETTKASESRLKGFQDECTMRVAERRGDRRKARQERYRASEWQWERLSAGVRALQKNLSGGGATAGGGGGGVAGTPTGASAAIPVGGKDGRVSPVHRGSPPRVPSSTTLPILAVPPSPAKPRDRRRSQPPESAAATPSAGVGAGAGAGAAATATTPASTSGGMSTSSSGTNLAALPATVSTAPGGKQGAAAVDNTSPSRTELRAAPVSASTASSAGTPTSVITGSAAAPFYAASDDFSDFSDSDDFEDDHSVLRKR